MVDARHINKKLSYRRDDVGFFVSLNISLKGYSGQKMN